MGVVVILLDTASPFHSLSDCLLAGCQLPPTYHLSMKSLIPSDQTRPISGSSFIEGTGAVTIYDSSSMGATYADSPSGGNGKRRWAISWSDRPRDQTSALME
jgi:hypothetical protein